MSFLPMPSLLPPALPSNPSPRQIVVHGITSDGHYGVIEAGDFEEDGTRARSKTRDTVAEAMNAPYDPALVIPVGAGSRHKFIKVKLSDLPGFDHKKKLEDLGLSPKDFAARSRKFIPQYPHTCHVCGGKMLILFSSVEHEGGVCPGGKEATGKLRRR